MQTDSPVVVAGTIFAAIAAIGAVSAVVVQLILRYRDRVAVRVTGIEIGPPGTSSLQVKVRNDGGGATSVTGIRFLFPGGQIPAQDHIPPASGHAAMLPGRDDAVLVFGNTPLIDVCPSGENISIAVTDQAGKLSKGFSLSAEVLQWIRFRP